MASRTWLFQTSEFSPNCFQFLWLVPRKRPSHYAIAMSQWVSEWISGFTRVSRLWYDTWIGLLRNYSVFNSYLRSLCDRLINLLPPSWLITSALPTPLRILLTTIILTGVRLLCPIFCFALVFILSKWSLFMHVGSNVRIIIVTRAQAVSQWYESQSALRITIFWLHYPIGHFITSYNSTTSQLCRYLGM